jgi:hypothetical protein
MHMCNFLSLFIHKQDERTIRQLVWPYVSPFHLIVYLNFELLNLFFTKLIMDLEGGPTQAPLQFYGPHYEKEIDV